MRHAQTQATGRERLHRLAEDIVRYERWADLALDDAGDAVDWDGFLHWSARAWAAEEAWTELARQLAEAP